MPSRPSAPKPPPLRDPARPLVPGSLSRRHDHGFVLRPDAAALAVMAEDLGALSLRKLRLEGRLIPEGREDWRLEAMLGATAVQPCVISAAPVTTRIDQPVLRRFLASLPPPAPGETELPEDDSVEPLGAAIDLMAVLHEALTLALPEYPRAEKAAAPENGAPENGVPESGVDDSAPSAPPEPETARPNPFAVLAGLHLPTADQDGGTGRDAGGDGPSEGSDKSNAKAAAAAPKSRPRGADAEDDHR